MKTFRIVFGILAVIPLVLLADTLFFSPTDNGEDSLKTLAFMLIGIPILAFNYWAWIYPEIIEYFFFGRDKAN